MTIDNFHNTTSILPNTTNRTTQENPKRQITNIFPLKWIFQLCSWICRMVQQAHIKDRALALLRNTPIKQTPLSCDEDQDVNIDLITDISEDDATVHDDISITEGTISDETITHDDMSITEEAISDGTIAHIEDDVNEQLDASPSTKQPIAVVFPINNRANEEDVLLCSQAMHEDGSPSVPMAWNPFSLFVKNKALEKLADQVHLCVSDNITSLGTDASMSTIHASLRHCITDIAGHAYEIMEALSMSEEKVIFKSLIDNLLASNPKINFPTGSIPISFEELVWPERDALLAASSNLVKEVKQKDFSHGFHIHKMHTSLHAISAAFANSKAFNIFNARFHDDETKYYDISQRPPNSPPIRMQAPSWHGDTLAQRIGDAAERSIYTQEVLRLQNQIIYLNKIRHSFCGQIILFASIIKKKYIDNRYGILHPVKLTQTDKNAFELYKRELIKQQVVPSTRQNHFNSQAKLAAISFIRLHCTDHVKFLETRIQILSTMVQSKLMLHVHPNNMCSELRIQMYNVLEDILGNHLQPSDDANVLRQNIYSSINDTEIHSIIDTYKRQSHNGTS